MCSKWFLKILLFHKELLEDFTETFQNAYWEKYTSQLHLPGLYGYFL